MLDPETSVDLFINTDGVTSQKAWIFRSLQLENLITCV